MRIGPNLRVAIVLAVVALMSYLTWKVHQEYWRQDCYRTVASGLLYVVRRADDDMLQRFRSRFGNTTLLDLRTDAELAAAPAGNQDRTTVLRLPLEPGRVPTPADLRRFLDLYANSNNLPLMLYAGPPPDGSQDIRIASLTAAFDHLVAGRSLDQSLSAALPDERSPHRAALREALATAARSRPAANAGPDP